MPLAPSPRPEVPREPLRLDPDVAARLSLPVLLVAGREDPLGSVPAQEALAAAIDDAGGTAELHVLDGVGHLLHYERPAACAALIRDWLRRAGR